MIKADHRRSYGSKPVPPFYQEVIDNLGDRFEDWAFRWSHKGVPHLLLESDGVVFSLCYFKKQDNWRLFYPYLSSQQYRADFGSWVEALDHIAYRSPNECQEGMKEAK